MLFIGTKSQKVLKRNVILQLLFILGLLILLSGTTVAQEEGGEGSLQNEIDSSSDGDVNADVDQYAAINFGESNEDYDEEEEEDDVDLEAEFHMDDFSPSHVFTFPIGPRQEECFFQDVTVTPTKLRGAYFVESGGSLQLDFTISLTNNMDSNEKNAMLKKSGLTENVFTFSAEQEGQYSFCFKNRENVSKTATLAIHVGTKTAEHAKRAHVTPLENAVRSMYRTVKEIVSEQEFFKMRTHRHIEIQDSTDQRVAWYTIFESLFMFSITLGQVFYVRRLINNRQWV